MRCSRTVATYSSIPEAINSATTSSTDHSAKGFLVFCARRRSNCWSCSCDLRYHQPSIDASFSSLFTDDVGLGFLMRVDKKTKETKTTMPGIIINETKVMEAKTNATIAGTINNEPPIHNTKGNMAKVIILYPNNHKEGGQDTRNHHHRGEITNNNNNVTHKRLVAGLSGFHKKGFWTSFCHLVPDGDGWYRWWFFFFQPKRYQGNADTCLRTMNRLVVVHIYLFCKKGSTPTTRNPQQPLHRQFDLGSLPIAPFGIGGGEGEGGQQQPKFPSSWNILDDRLGVWAKMDFSVPVVQLQAQLLEYQSQQKEIERKLQQPDTDQSELQGLLDDIKEIIAAYKEVLQSKGVATNTEQDKKKPVSSAPPPPTLKGITKKKSKGRKDQALKERVLSWQQFHSKHGARRKSIFQSPEEGSRTRVGFQGSPGTLTAIPPRKKHEFVNLNQDN